MTTRPQAKPSVLVALRDRGSFLETYFPADGTGGIVVPGQLHYDIGEDVQLELNFLAEQRTFRIKGQVKWKRDVGETLPQALGVAFLDGERATRDLILDFVRGKEISFKERSDHRFPVSLQISYKSDSAFITDWTDDLSQGGAFIVTDRMLPLGTVLPIKIKVPGSILPLKLRGQVCWVRAGEPAGMGVKFLVENDRQRKKLEALVAEMKSQIIQQVHGRRNSRPPTEA